LALIKAAGGVVEHQLLKNIEMELQHAGEKARRGLRADSQYCNRAREKARKNLVKRKQKILCKIRKYFSAFSEELEPSMTERPL
jgi:hypothetical protein